MTWQAIGTIVAMLALIATLVLTLRGQRLTRDLTEKAQLHTDEMAERSASRAEAAARVSEGYTARVVEALEAMATGSANPRHVRWSMQHRGGDTFVLTNTGEATATNVDLRGHESLFGLELVPADQSRVLDPADVLVFMAAASMATSDRTITVSWDDADGTARAWRYPLPPNR